MRSVMGAVAYERIKSLGLLSVAQTAVYGMLYERGPCTRNEIDAHLVRRRRYSAAAQAPNPSYSRRLTEMERRGVVERVGTRKCSVTGFACDLWDVTSALPTPAVRPPPAPSAATLARALAAIRLRPFTPVSSELQQVLAWLDWRAR